MTETKTNDSINVITKDQYPFKFENVSSPPEKLFIRGSLSGIGQKILCVVGARYPNSYGLDACRKLILGLKGYPISIVSGLAIGIDSYSHEVALEAGLHCIGFPGSPLDWDLLYPPTSVPVAKRMIENGGALLSEYSYDTPYGKWAFPMRNMYMAGMSHATLVIQARGKSGSLMTAGYATEFGRDVLSVPGSIFSDLAMGTHKLLKDHANPATCSEDILRILGFDVNAGYFMDSPAFYALDTISQSILREVARGDTTIDSIMTSLCLNVSEVNEKIAILEMNNVINLDGNHVRFIK